MSKSKKTPEALEQIDINLRGLLGKFGETLDTLLGELGAVEEGETQHSRRFSTPDGKVQAETSVRVRMGGLGDLAAKSAGGTQNAERAFRPVKSKSATSKPPKTAAASPPCGR